MTHNRIKNLLRTLLFYCAAGMGSMMCTTVRTPEEVAERRINEIKEKLGESEYNKQVNLLKRLFSLLCNDQNHNNLPDFQALLKEHNDFQMINIPLSHVLKSFDAPKENLLGIAINKDDLQYVETLLEHSKNEVILLEQSKNQAIINGNPHILNALLNHGADGFNSSSLLLALQHNHVDFLKRFLQEKRVYKQEMLVPLLKELVFKGPPYSNRADVLSLLIQEAPKHAENGGTLLHIIATWTIPDMAVLEQIIQTGININARDKEGNTPLHIACNHAHLGIVQVLLAYNQIEATQRNKEGNTPLHIACSHAPPDIVQALINHYRSHIPSNCNTTAPYQDCINLPNLEGYTPLHLAIKSSYPDPAVVKVRALLKAGANIDQDGPLPYNQGISGIIHRQHFTYDPIEKLNYPGLVQTMRDGQANFNNPVSKRGTPLYVAAEMDDQSVMELLIENGANPYLALERAVIQQALPVLERLLKLHTPSTQALRSLLLAAMPTRNIAIVNRLLSINRFPINDIADDTNGDTLLHIAVKMEWTEMVQELDSKGADPTRKNRNGLRPMHFAQADSQIYHIIRRGTRSATT